MREILFHIQQVARFFRETTSFLGELHRNQREQKGASADLRIAYHGYSAGPKRDWLYTFIEHWSGRKLAVSWYRPSLIICSPFGSYWLLQIMLRSANVPSLFFTEENIATLKKYRQYRTYVNGLPSLCLGFDYLTAPNYQRFPLWLMYLFPAEFAATASPAAIQQRLDHIERQRLLPRTKFAAMIASHDGYTSSRKVYGPVHQTSRSTIATQLSAIDFVNCPGRLLHNDDSLVDHYNDDKILYLKEFLFNICAENAAVKGYVTEKIFEAVAAGTIPIYWGDERPEPGILNQQRILFWNEADQQQTMDRVTRIYHNAGARENFLGQPVFTSNAAQEIFNHFEQLRAHLGKILPGTKQP